MRRMTDAASPPMPWPPLPWGPLAGPTLLTARWVVADLPEGRRLLEAGEVVIEGDRIAFAGHAFTGEVARRVDYGNALLLPGFVDLDALGDLDTTVLAFDNQPGWRKGRVWPRSYMQAGPVEMYGAEALSFQRRYAFAHLLRNGVTTALPIASLFYRAWGETEEEFAAAADHAVDLGLRAYLGPAYRSGNQVVESDGTIVAHIDEARGMADLDKALRFAARFDGHGKGLVRAMLAPDRIETCTPELLRRTAEAVREAGWPVRLHCCQSAIEYEMVLKLRGMSPPEWLASLGVLSPRAILPHGTHVSGSRHVARPGRDLEILRDAGATIVTCPIVSARHGAAIDHFARYRAMGLNLGLGTDTWPPDLLANLQCGLMLARVMAADLQAVRAEDLLDAATLGGARALGRDDLGRIAVGAKADIVAWGLGLPHQGPVIDPVQTLLIGGRGHDALAVLVDGQARMQQGVIPGVDWDAFAARAQAQFEGMVAELPRRTLGHPPVAEILSSAYPVRRR
jgi:cytosine/adenosine deaminase-related metal-dependent hydrolase